MHLLDTPKQRSVRNALLCYLGSFTLGVSAVFSMVFTMSYKDDERVVTIVILAVILAAHSAVQLQQQASLWLHPKQPCKYRPHS
ncbi:MAG: hypothetical protein KC662_02310 [Candidatus Magasanikbacteria bacterium]|nr:hypothetical protein [Candidatus Magasanikbacteria bacterium]